MEYLTQDAAQTYLGLCRMSFMDGIIGRYEFISRMKALSVLAAQDGWPTRYALMVLESEGWDVEQIWPEGCQSEKGLFGKETQIDQSGLKDSEARGRTDDDGFSISLMTDPSMKLSKKWNFHKGDADPHPSVPHGHDAKDDRRKLHAYLGHKTFQGEPDGRESREAIIRLWNDSKFREFALQAITHFVTMRPEWTWDRDPFILPRLRSYI